jgi:hypothetical protein
MSAKSARSDAEHRHLMAQSSGGTGTPSSSPPQPVATIQWRTGGQFYEQFLVHVRVQMTSPLLVQLTATSA